MNHSIDSDKFHMEVNLMLDGWAVVEKLFENVDELGQN